jgi:WD40 repeat protein
MPGMTTVFVRHAWLSRTLRGWRGRLAHRKGMIGLLLAMVLMAGLWVPWPWESEWATRAVLRTPGDTWPIAFSPDGRTLASWDGHSITLWDVATGRKTASWKVADGLNAGHGAFSPDGRTFASLRSAYPGPITFELIDVETGRTRAPLPTQHSRFYALMFVDEGRSLRAFLGDMDDLEQVVTWDVATGKETGSRTLACHVGAADVAISPDGHLMSLAPFNGATIRIQDLEADREIASLTHPSPDLDLARGFAFSRNGRALVAGREDGSFEIWDLETMQLKRTFPGHTDGHQSFGIRLAPDGRTLASWGEFRAPRSISGGLWHVFQRTIRGPRWRPDPEVIVVDLATGRRLARAKSALYPQFAPDGTTIATRPTDLTIHLHPAPGALIGRGRVESPWQTRDCRPGQGRVW